MVSLTAEPTGLPDDESILGSIYRPQPEPTKGRGGANNAPEPAPEAENEPVEEVSAEPGPDDLDLLDAAGDPEKAPEIDPDDVEYDVAVDGATTKAKLRELKSAFSGAKAVEGRLQQAAETRRQAEAVGSKLYEALEVQKTRLTQIDNALKDVAQPAIDWAALLQADPQRYLIEKEKSREAEGRRAVVAKEQERVNSEQQGLRQQANVMFAQDQARILVAKLPELRDPVRAKTFADDLNFAGKEYNFSEAEIAGLVDHRHVLVLNDAIKYRKLVKAREEKLKAPKTPAREETPSPQPRAMIRPGAANFSARMSSAKSEKAAAERASQTGSLDDVAAMLITTRKKNTGGF